jgi:hypothetical protein
MKDLFYSKTKDEKVLFRIIGYAGESQVVNEQMAMIKKEASEFAKLAGVPMREVRSELIQHSSRYKYMRVFFVNNYDKPLPEGTFDITKENNKYDWSFRKWLEN